MPCNSRSKVLLCLYDEIYPRGQIFSYRQICAYKRKYPQRQICPREDIIKSKRKSLFAPGVYQILRLFKVFQGMEVLVIQI